MGGLSIIIIALALMVLVAHLYVGIWPHDDEKPVLSWNPDMDHNQWLQVQGPPPKVSWRK